MNNRIIHISIDEKFINSAYWQFETVFKNKNIFYVLVDDFNTQLKFIKKEYNIKLVDSSEHFIKHLNETDILIIHSLNPKFYDIILGLPKTIKCIWMCFGFEVYNDNNFISQKSILAPHTTKLYRKPKPNYKNAVKESLYPFHRLLHKSKVYSSFEWKKKVIDRVDYLGTTFIEEYLNVNTLLNTNKPLFEFSYYPIENITKGMDDIELERPNILIGNSGFITNNHTDVFYKIKNYKLENQKIITPLSYGSKNYVNQVTVIGKELFQDSFKPLSDFLQLEDYNKIIKSCGVSIFNNYRQQAVGNSIALLWCGSKVFLNSNNPFYFFLKRIGFFVFDIDNDLNKKSIKKLLTFEEIKHNRLLLLKYFSSEVLLKKLKNQIEALNA